MLAYLIFAVLALSLIFLYGVHIHYRFEKLEADLKRFHNLVDCRAIPVFKAKEPLSKGDLVCVGIPYGAGFVTKTDL